MVDTRKSILLVRKIPQPMDLNHSAVGNLAKNCCLVVIMNAKNCVTMETVLIVRCYQPTSLIVLVDRHYLLISLELCVLIQLLPVIKSAIKFYHVVLQISIIIVNKNATMVHVALVRKSHMYDVVAEYLRKISHVLKHLSSLKKAHFFVKNVAIKNETVANTNVHSHVVCELCMIVSETAATCSLVDAIDVSALVTVATVRHV